MTNIKDIIEWWERPYDDGSHYETIEEMQKMYKWRIDESMKALKEAIEIIERYSDLNKENYGFVDYCNHEANKWILRWIPNEKETKD